MEWIIKPNKWYDNVEEPYRMLIILGLMIGLFLIFGFPIGMAIFCIVGIYRITYHIIMDSRKLTQAKS